VAHSLTLRGGRVVTSLRPSVVEDADVSVADGRVVAVGQAGGGGTAIDCTGCLIIPGNVCAHTHVYSALARGMPFALAPPTNFVEILQRVWWRLDRALDAESVHLSGLVGAIEAARSGTTLLIDHHSSPSFIRGSLGALQQVLEQVGLRSALCYEVTDRNGREGRDLGVEENVTFARERATGLTRGLVGAHASFTLSDESLGRLAHAVAETGSSLHIHVAEDRADGDDARARHGGTVADRLDRHGLLAARALLAHCVHLSADEVRLVHAKGCWIAHNPRSNMNNAVGYAPTPELRRAALGTDGIDEDMFAEARAAYLKMRDVGREDAVAATLQLIAGGHRLAAALFGLPFGKLDAGGPADLVVLDYRPPTVLHADNLGGHLLFGIDRSHVSSVMVAGRWILRDRRVETVDAGEAFARARDAARDLWVRMESGGV
jgi:putative selenium metabolism protein SsnA